MNFRGASLFAVSFDCSVLSGCLVVRWSVVWSLCFHVVVVSAAIPTLLHVFACLCARVLCVYVSLLLTGRSRRRGLTFVELPLAVRVGHGLLEAQVMHKATLYCGNHGVGFHPLLLAADDAPARVKARVHNTTASKS